MKISTLPELSKYFEEKQHCIDFLIQMRWNGVPKCVFCDHHRVYELKGQNKRYKCAKCRKQFSVIKGTIFENSPISLQKWFVAIYVISSHKKGISSIQLAKDIGVTQKTAWFMNQRIRYALKVKSFDKMEGLVQCDETYVGGKNKNRVGDNKDKHGNSQGRSLKNKTPVFGIVGNGQIYTEVVPNVKTATLKPIIKKMVEEGSIVVTDEYMVYNHLKKEYHHEVIQHRLNEFVRNGYHTNTIEGFWSLLKRGLYGIYHQVSPKHLHRYCDEFSFRYNTRKMMEDERFEHLMKKINCRLTYDELTEK